MVAEEKTKYTSKKLSEILTKYTQEYQITVPIVLIDGFANKDLYRFDHKAWVNNFKDNQSFIKKIQPRISSLGIIVNKIKELDDWRDFEKLCVFLLNKQANYKCSISSDGRDGGLDFYGIKNKSTEIVPNIDNFDNTYIFGQCKHYNGTISKATVSQWISDINDFKSKKGTPTIKNGHIKKILKVQIKQIFSSVVVLI